LNVEQSRVPGGSPTGKAQAVYVESEVKKSRSSGLWQVNMEEMSQHGQDEKSVKEKD